MAKTVCEEAADYANAWEFDDLAKRLRAEGRKIRRYERLICKTVEKLTDANITALEREAARILKARTKK